MQATDRAGQGPPGAGGMPRTLDGRLDADNIGVDRRDVGGLLDPSPKIAYDARTRLLVKDNAIYAPYMHNARPPLL